MHEGQADAPNGPRPASIPIAHPFVGAGRDESGAVVMNRAGYFVCLCCPRQDPYGGLPDPNRGLVRKIRDALVNLVRHGRLDDGSFAARQRD